MAIAQDNLLPFTQLSADVLADFLSAANSVGKAFRHIANSIIANNLSEVSRLRAVDAAAIAYSWKS